MEKKEWTEPTLTEFDVAERTENLTGDGPDGGATLSSESEGGGGGGGGS